MYAHRDDEGKIKGLYQWPNELTDKTPADPAEIQAFKSRPKERPTLSRLEQTLIQKGIITEQDLKL
jgi:hypothetical protein